MLVRSRGIEQAAECGERRLGRLRHIDDLQLGELLEPLFSELIAETRLLGAAEWNRGVELSVFVDPDRASIHFFSQRIGFIQVRRPHRTTKAPGTRIGTRYCIVLFIKLKEDSVGCLFFFNLSL